MRAAGLLVFQVLDTLKKMVAEGVSTHDLEVTAEKMIADGGARAAFKGYPNPSAGTKFPYVLCVSVNDEIVHGMPSQKKILKSGDIVSIDTGVQLNGYYGDSAITVAVGRISEEAQRLIDVTRESLDLAIAEVRPGKRLGDVSAAVQRHAEAAGFGIVRAFVGHGIGRELHEDPQVPNFGEPGKGPVLRAGMVLAIEPMVTMGHWEVRVLKDRWTAVTEDGSLAAHFEHTVAITEAGPDVLTGPPSGGVV